MDKVEIQKIIDVGEAQWNDRATQVAAADPMAREIRGWVNAHREMLKSLEAEAKDEPAEE